jgi:hypothetical protein
VQPTLSWVDAARMPPSEGHKARRAVGLTDPHVKSGVAARQQPWRANDVVDHVVSADVVCAACAYIDTRPEPNGVAAIGGRQFGK